MKENKKELITKSLEVIAPKTAKRIFGAVEIFNLIKNENQRIAEFTFKLMELADENSELQSHLRELNDKLSLINSEIININNDVKKELESQASKLDSFINLNKFPEIEQAKSKCEELISMLELAAKEVQDKINSVKVKNPIITKKTTKEAMEKEGDNITNELSIDFDSISSYIKLLKGAETDITSIKLNIDLNQLNKYEDKIIELNEKLSETDVEKLSVEKEIEETKESISLNNEELKSLVNSFEKDVHNAAANEIIKRTEDIKK